MKKHTLALALALAGLLAPATQAALVSLSPSSQSRIVNDTFSIDVNISGLGASQIVSAFDLDIYFDPTVITGTFSSLNDGAGSVLGGTLGGLWDGTGNAVSAGHFSLSAFTLTYDPAKSDSDNDNDLAALQTDDSFTLATLNFKAVGAGVSQVAFGLGANERDIVGRDAAFISGLQFSGACVAVNPVTGGSNTCASVSVPEPASYGLVGLALAGLLIPRARRRAQNVAA